MKATVKDFKTLYDGNSVSLTINVDKDYRRDVQNIANRISAGKPYVLTLEPKKKARSLNANNYAWALLGEIAKNLGVTKEEVYRKIIREVGAYTVLEIAEKALPNWMSMWHSLGIGWITEVLDRRNGYVSVIAYKGSSTYDTLEMSRLIDGIVSEAKELGIETMTPAELSLLKEGWTP